MPYIKQEQREQFDAAIDNLAKLVETDGQLNYVITRLVCRCLAAQPRYDLIARAVGTLECAKLEFYRRLAGPYEDGAVERNGDVEEYEKMNLP